MSVLNVNYARKRFTPAISGKMSISVGGVMISKARLRYVYYRALFNVTIVAKDSVTQSNYVWNVTNNNKVFLLDKGEIL